LDGPSEQPWVGFARAEILEWWRTKGAELVDIHADRFAIRSEFDRQVRWSDVPESYVIRGLIDTSRGGVVLRIVTRTSTPDEQSRWQTARVPLIEPALFSPHPIHAVGKSEGPLL
jgi:hypothetical protein